MLIQEFSSGVKHCPSKQNEFADLLSRNPVEELHHALNDQNRMFLPNTSIQTPPESPVTEVLYNIGEPLMIPEITLSQKTDPRMTRLTHECTDSCKRVELTARELLFLQRNKVSNEDVL